LKALTIIPETGEVGEIDIEMKANTVYTFFNSILIDEHQTLNRHLIYSDANALSSRKKPFFLGEQLILGNALVVGQNGMEETDASIPAKELEALLDYKINGFYTETLALLSHSDINLYRLFELQKNGEPIALNIEWVLYTFNMADERTKAYFLDELKKAVDRGVDTLEHLKKMGQLALNAAQR